MAKEGEEKYKLSIDIPLEQPRSGGFAGPLALHVRHQLEDLIDDRGIGKCYGGGSGMSAMDVSLGVDDLHIGVGETCSLLKELGIRQYRITQIAENGEILRVLKDTTQEPI